MKRWVFILGTMLVIAGVVLFFYLRREEPTPITQLVEKISNENDSRKKEELLKELAQLEPSRSADFKVLGNQKKGDIRLAALSAIKNTKRFSWDLVRMVDENPDDLQLMEQVAMAISGLRNKEDVPALIDLLEGRRSSEKPGDALMLEAAITALGAMKDDRAMEILLKREEYFNVHMGGTPISSYGKKVLPRLVQIAQGENGKKDNRSGHAAAAIGNITDPEAIPKLVEIAQIGGLDSDIRVQALMALHLMKAKEGTETAEKLLADRDTHVQAKVARILIWSGDKNLIDKAVERLPTAGNYVQGMIVMDLREKKDISHAVAIEKLVADDEPDVRKEAIQYLAQADYEKYLPTILDSLSDESWIVREISLQTLGAHKEQQAIPYAEKLLDDHSDNVRFAATKLLKATTGKTYPYRETSETKTKEEIYKWEHPNER